MRQVGFLFKNESDLDNTLEANRRTLAIDTQGNKTPLSDSGITYAKVTALVVGSGDKEVKAVEVVFDGATNTHVAPDGIAWIYDSDNINDDHTTTNIRSSVKLSVNDIIEVAFYPDKSEVSQWIKAGLGGGAQRPFIKITTSTDVNNYIANVITPTSATVLVTGVTVKALEPDAGQKLPVGREMFADIVDGVYYIQPAVAYGS